MPKKRIPLEIKPCCSNCKWLSCPAVIDNPCSEWIPKEGFMRDEVNKAKTKKEEDAKETNQSGD